MMNVKYSAVKTEDDSNGFLFDYTSAFDFSSYNKMKMVNSRNRYKSAFTYHSVSPSYEEGRSSESVREETWPSMILRSVIIYVCYIIIIVLFPISVWFCLKKIVSLERIVILRLGKLQPVKGPGFAFVLPCIDKWTVIDLRPKTFIPLPQQLLTSDGGIIETTAEVHYRISDVVHYVTRVNNQDHAIQELGLHCLTNIISEKSQEDLEVNREIIQAKLKTELNNTVIQWGLEVMEVIIYPIKVLKAAEPIDAVGTLMSALKAAADVSPTQTATVIPSAINIPASSSSHKEMCTSLSESTSTNHSDLVSTIRSLADTAVRKGVFNGMSANFKMEIVGDFTRVIYCSIQDGKSSVFEGDEHNVNPDVSIMLSEDNLQDFLSSKVSLVQAYLEGRIMVTGDWSLLRTFAKVLE